ncbi:MAG: hypothetical protein ABS59_04395 [Methylobacterium sp. SCN 67-24]|nr:MAG: hypothetical protein ABS59_04395 [Methylobacterium sp. SCN 67-24]
MGCGILAIWHDIVPEHQTDVLFWYDREHHFERLAVPGFRSVRRYQAEPGTSPQLFIRYETESIATLSAPAYLERLNQPTPWTLRCQPQFRGNSRTVCERIESHGGAEGGCAVTIRLAGPMSAELRQAIGRANAGPQTCSARPSRHAKSNCAEARTAMPRRYWSCTHAVPKKPRPASRS